MTSGVVSRIGVKGQIVLRKKLREKAGLREGALVEEVAYSGGILIKPLNPQKLLEEMDAIAKKVSREWPKGLTAVEAVRRDRT